MFELGYWFYRAGAEPILYDGNAAEAARVPLNSRLRDSNHKRFACTGDHVRPDKATFLS